MHNLFILYINFYNYKFYGLFSVLIRLLFRYNIPADFKLSLNM